MDTRTVAAGPTRPPRLYLWQLLKRAAVDVKGQRLGKLIDVIVHLQPGGYPPVTGLVADLGRQPVFVPASAVRSWHSDRIELASARVDLRKFERRETEVLLRADVLGHRLIDLAEAKLVRAHDVELADTGHGWVLRALDVHALPWLHLPGRHHRHVYRDWSSLAPLIGHQASSALRAPWAPLRKLRPAQIADLLETASSAEQREILSHVHTNPDLEADVFEELDEDRQAQLFADRSDAEVAEVLANMRPDDAADAIIDLPQPRRAPVLDLLPAAQRAKITILLGYQPATAGGLMGVDYVALPMHATVAQALAAVREATSAQPEALTNVYSTDPDGRLAGVAGVVRLLQSAPDATLAMVGETGPIRVAPHADLIEITTVMADFNLLTLPVVDESDHLLGLVTIDDILEAAIPDNWRRREPAEHPNHPER